MPITTLVKTLAEKSTLVLLIRVRVNAETSSLGALLSDGSLKVNLAAPATDNRANTALVALLATAFCVPTSNVQIISGQSSRFKLVKINAHH